MPDIDFDPLVSAIPNPQTVKLHLATLTRQRRLLRSLLRLAESKEAARLREQVQQEDHKHAS
jgi:hypothetical protein